MHLRAHPIALLISFAFLVPSLRADSLAWEKTKIHTEVMEGEQTEVKAAFPFKNTSDHTVTITSVQTSCGCTTAGLSKRTYAAGERGEIDAVFHPAGRVGLQEKYIIVTTDDPRQAPMRVLFEINITQYFTMTPRYFAWIKGETPSEKLIVLLAASPQPFTDIGVQVQPAGSFITRLETVEKGQKYNLYVKPSSTAERLSSAVFVDVKFANRAERKAEAYVYVNPPGVSQTDD
jgi:hypothetical protein